MIIMTYYIIIVKKLWFSNTVGSHSHQLHSFMQIYEVNIPFHLAFNWNNKQLRQDMIEIYWDI